MSTKEIRSLLQEDYEVLVSPALQHMGFMRDHETTDPLGNFETSHILAQISLIQSVPGQLGELVSRYGSLFFRRNGNPLSVSNRYQLQFYGQIKDNSHKGCLNLTTHTVNTSTRDDADHLFKVVAPLTYYTGNRLISLMTHSLQCVDKIEKREDFEPNWLVHPIPKSARSFQLPTNNLMVVYPNRESSSNNALDEAEHIIKDGYRLQ